MTGQSDAGLIVESLAEPARFGEIFDRHAEVIFRHLARRIGPDDAADVMDSDSGRLRFGAKDMSKQAYRDGSQSLPEFKRTFEEVAELTGQFVRGTRPAGSSRLRRSRPEHL